VNIKEEDEARDIVFGLDPFDVDWCDVDTQTIVSFPYERLLPRVLPYNLVRVFF
jgi:hypothetical protein